LAPLVEPFVCATVFVMGAASVVGAVP